MARRRTAAIVAAMLVLGCVGLSLGGCAPSSAAVGDSMESSAMAHDGIDRSDVLMAFIGAETAATKSQDRQVLEYLQTKSMRTQYASSGHVTDAQAKAIEAAIASRSTMILLRCNATGNTTGCNFNDRVVAALRGARDDGIPTVLVSSSRQSTTLDPHLYAAQFVLQPRSDDTDSSKHERAGSYAMHRQQSIMSLEAASFIVMNDGEHAKTMYVSY
ncbi:hypothetical protein [Bifidobacterium aquikefiricola]|uniref:Lipoprotein n=2 Tax=Bifidobacterium TaxID=1678 RepID=A0AB39U496_9BIFI